MYHQPYTVRFWKEEGLWHVQAHDNSIFKDTAIAVALGQVFKKVKAAIMHIPFEHMNLSPENLGNTVLKNKKLYNIAILAA